MTPDLLVFLILAVIAILAALGLLTSRNAIYAALFLILNFSTVAVMYLLLNAPFLAIVQVSVYAGAIMVLFLFVIMLLGAERLSSEESKEALQWQRPLAIGLGVLLLVQAGYVFFTQLTRVPAAGLATVDSSPLAIGKMLFGQYLFPFEAASILLLVAMVGAVVLTRDK